MSRLHLPTPIIGVAAVALFATGAHAQDATYDDVPSFLAASGSLADGSSVRIRKAVVSKKAIAAGGQLRPKNEVEAEHGFGWSAELIEPRFADPHLDFHIAATSASSATFRVRVITRAYMDDGDGEIIEQTVRHAPLGRGLLVEVRGRMARAGTDRFLFIEPVLQADGLNVDSRLRVFGDETGAPLAPTILGPVYESSVVKAGGTVLLQGYHFDASTTRLTARSGNKKVALPIVSVASNRQRITARVPLTVPHGAVTITAEGGEGQAKVAVLHVPVITSVTPNKVAAGERITIRGRFLTDYSAIEKVEVTQPTLRLDGSNLRVIDLSETRIVAEVSSLESAGVHQLVLQNEAGAAKVSLEVTKPAGPKIDRADVAGGYLLLQGQDFGSAPVVTFESGAAAQVVFKNAGLIVVKLPSGVGSGKVRVGGGPLLQFGPSTTIGLTGGLSTP